MPVIVRTSDAPYRWKIEAAPLERVANREKKMPAGFIRRDGHGITAAARRYLEPLIRGEAYPPYGADGLPAYATPARAMVRPQLENAEVDMPARAASNGAAGAAADGGTEAGSTGGGN
jgi:6-phosphofructokinase 1